MGTSTDAILFYGITWEDEHRLFAECDDCDDDIDQEWESVLAKRRGIINPWDTSPSDCSQSWVDSHRVEIDNWHAQKEAIKAEFNVDISSHCSGECPIPYIYHTASRIVSHRGYSNIVTSLDSQGYAEDIARFIKELKIDVSEASGINWFLVSDWT